MHDEAVVATTASRRGRYNSTIPTQRDDTAMSVPGKRHWPDHVLTALKSTIIDADDRLDDLWRRIDTRLGRNRPRYLAAYRGYADATGTEVMGRVLSTAPEQQAGIDDSWWDNLLDTWRRFESDEVPHAPLQLRFRDAQLQTRSDHEGYWQATLEPTMPAGDALWDNATASLPDGTLLTPQPILQIGPRARIGIISDIDDTVLFSGITQWKLAAQLTFLHNARTRKPLAGVAALYRALQHGADGSGRHPLFYVSSSPWNLYDLLDDFMELNALPAGPMFLRDLGTDDGKFLKTAGHGHKLERASELIERFPQLRWVLLGDSGQADAELYAEAARRFGSRIAAIYIRDVDPDADSTRDLQVDGHIHRIGATGVPMLRVADSSAIARHAADAGLIARDQLPGIDAETRRDRERKSILEAAADAATDSDPDAPDASRPLN